MAVITISRQLGSWGDEIASELCKQLNYTMFNKSMIEEIVTTHGLLEGELVDLDDEHYKVRTLLDRLIDLPGPHPATQIRTWRENASGGRTVAINKLDEAAAVNLVESAIQAAYRRDNMIIVGRAGQVILRDRPGVLHVRCVASHATRLRHLTEQGGLQTITAEEYIKQQDRSAAGYLKRFYHVDWSDPTLYHMVINTGYWTIPAAVDLVLACLNRLLV